MKETSDLLEGNMDKVQAGDIVFAILGLNQYFSKCQVGHITSDRVCTLKDLSSAGVYAYTMTEDRLINYHKDYIKILNDLTDNKEKKVLDILGQGSYVTKVSFYDVYFSKNRNIKITFPEHLSNGGFGVYRIYLKQMNKFNKIYTTSTFSLKNPPLSLYEEIQEVVNNCYEIIKIKEAFKSKKGL